MKRIKISKTGTAPVRSESQIYMISLPQNIKDINELMEENPEIKKIAKIYNKKDFIPLDFVIFSQPQTHPKVTIYGRFVIVKKNVEKNLKLQKKCKSEIKQDFIAFNRQTKAAIYFSGGSKDCNLQHRSIKCFCAEYGKHLDGSWGQYECSKKLTTDNHWYDDENDNKLPSEPYIRDHIKTKIVNYRKQLIATFLW